MEIKVWFPISRLCRAWGRLDLFWGVVGSLVPRLS